ncbi:hypothetical protein DFP93_103282 [Aneurinibacillus soli]|uniref:Uncharacterized protein n=1 Tax=Aneurinibacillus soli TaxID=1500254 RepID=A0A0U5BF26_9BACL|nr:hypothetical protein DFP93_103282 [Aneurinibacillus soli]BAU28871.1 hypothetical protein CB4_03048 [Aneurinibacillus soli]
MVGMYKNLMRSIAPTVFVASIPLMTEVASVLSAKHERTNMHHYWWRIRWD